MIFSDIALSAEVSSVSLSILHSGGAFAGGRGGIFLIFLSLKKNSIVEWCEALSSISYSTAPFGKILSFNILCNFDVNIKFLRHPYLRIESSYISSL